MVSVCYYNINVKQSGKPRSESHKMTRSSSRMTRRLWLGWMNAPLAVTDTWKQILFGNYEPQARLRPASCLHITVLPMGIHTMTRSFLFDLSACVTRAVTSPHLSFVPRAHWRNAAYTVERTGQVDRGRCNTETTNRHAARARAPYNR